MRANLTPFEAFQEEQRKKREIENAKKVIVVPRVKWSEQVLKKGHYRAALESPLKRWWLEQNHDRLYPNLRDEKFKAE